MSSPIDYRCPKCGSRDVVTDACAEWDRETQTWELRSTHDAMTCQECGHEASHAGEWSIPLEQRIEPAWRDIATVPKREPIYIDVRFTTTISYRWRPYRRGSSKAQLAKGGRWQRANEYGWENAELPPTGEWKPNMPITAEEARRRETARGIHALARATAEACAMPTEIEEEA